MGAGEREAGRALTSIHQGGLVTLVVHLSREGGHEGERPTAISAIALHMAKHLFEKSYRGVDKKKRRKGQTKAKYLLHGVCWLERALDS